jgi:hypothetical protein
MSVKENQCVVTTVVTEAEKRLFVEMARSLNVPYTVLMRRLIRYFLDEKMSWADLFRQYNELSFPEAPEGSRKKPMRARMDPGEYAAFAQRTEEWGSTTSIVIRRLILLYIAGRIEKGVIWY